VRAVKTVLQTIIAQQGTQLLHALPVIHKKRWELDWENKKMTALGVSSFPSIQTELSTKSQNLSYFNYLHHFPSDGACSLLLSFF
jgi:hypothetical protein